MPNRQKDQPAEQTGPLAKEPKAPAAGRSHRRTEPPDHGPLATARRAVREFLTSEFQARGIRVTRVCRSPEGADTWHVEAEILVPDLGIKTLGLPLSHEVLEKEYCTLELDPDMTIRSFEIFDLDAR